ncbi:RebB family R body protein [Sneathiella chinensis]|uniref:RebB like protein n=1 Tax=Sneathiella chinensis TaxID=349750 RepID=A0ABQ5U3G6_9PROT|nr:RebB family R body protein [Sneathiella chinensis]GLQ06694.1 hypothetical protein GCM10007924_19150 [Sneathiella chinensis]
MTANNNSTPVKSVNSQITDAITQSNMLATGMAPAHSMATLYQSMAQSIGASVQNAVSNQQNVNSVNLAALSQNIQLILQRPQPATRIIHSAQPIVLHTEAPKQKKRRKNDSDT